MLEAILAAIAGEVISYLLEQVGVSEKIRSWLGRDPQRLAFQIALTKAYTTFSNQYPDLAASFFDEHFLNKIVPILARCLQPNNLPASRELVSVWTEQFGIGLYDQHKVSSRARGHIQERIEILLSQLQAAAYW